MGDAILLVEDDVSLRETTGLLLERAGLSVTTVGDGLQALDLFAAAHFDLLIIDLMLPSVDGLDVCRQIRRTSGVPIVILTARTATEEVVAGLECGADDYVTKPFAGAELVARVRAALRRPAADDPGEVIRAGTLVIDSRAVRLTRAGAEVDLTAIEFRLLLELARHPDQVLSREHLLERVWGYDYLGDSRLVDMAINRLRTKIGDDARTPRYITTVRGVGYRFARL
jgi:two-component system, OmpR family, response regulator MtrA